MVVVDLLEMVDIDHQDAQWLFRLLAECSGFPQMHLNGPTIENPCQGISHRGLFKLLSLTPQILGTPPKWPRQLGLRPV